MFNSIITGRTLQWQNTSDALRIFKLWSLRNNVTRHKSQLQRQAVSSFCTITWVSFLLGSWERWHSRRSLCCMKASSCENSSWQRPHLCTSSSAIEKLYLDGKASHNYNIYSFNSPKCLIQKYFAACHYSSINVCGWFYLYLCVSSVRFFID